MKNTVRFIVGAALWIFCSLTSQAQTWTAVGSTGAIDPVSFPHVSLAGPALTFTSSFSATTLIVRYNVTNTFDNNASPNKPGWTRMEIGYFGRRPQERTDCSPLPAVLTAGKTPAVPD